MRNLARLARRAFELLHLLALLLIPLILAACTSGCAGGFGLVRIMEPPLKEIDTAELAANLPTNKALHIAYDFQSMQPDSSLSAGNDANLNLGNITDLISFGAGMAAADSSAKAFADIANKDRRINVQITIADSPDIKEMRLSDNATRLVQQAKNVEVFNRLVLTQTVSVITAPLPPLPGVANPPTDPVATNAPPVDPEIPPELPDNSLDQLDVRKAILLGTHARVNPSVAQTTRLLTKSDIDGGKVLLDYESLGWPDNDSGVGSDIDSRVYIFWKEGEQVYGGHFEWKRPGQKEKTLDNVFEGYLGRKPAPGSEVWFCLVKNDGTERTNVLKSNTPFP